MSEARPGHVVLTNVRLSYVHLDKPYSQNNDPEDARYSATILLPKTDKRGKAALDAALAEAVEKAKEKHGRSFPPAPKTSIHDGDGVRPSDGMPFPDECKGMWVFNARSKQAPQCVDMYKQPLLDPTEIYSGCWAHVGVTLYGYVNSANKGVAVALETVMKARDGEPLGGARASAEDDFADIPAVVGAPPEAVPAGQTIVGYDPNTFEPIYG